MKAQEYYNKYFENACTTVEFFERSKAMLNDMMDEFAQLKKTRNAKTASAVISIVKEINAKWNAVANEVEKKHGERILRRNVVYNLVLHDAYPNEFPRKPD